MSTNKGLFKCLFSLIWSSCHSLNRPTGSTVIILNNLKRYQNFQTEMFTYKGFIQMFSFSLSCSNLVQLPQLDSSDCVSCYIFFFMQQSYEHLLYKIIRTMTNHPFAGRKVHERSSSCRAPPGQEQRGGHPTCRILQPGAGL